MADSGEPSCGCAQDEKVTQVAVAKTSDQVTGTENPKAVDIFRDTPVRYLGALTMANCTLGLG